MKIEIPLSSYVYNEFLKGGVKKKPEQKGYFSLWWSWNRKNG